MRRNHFKITQEELRSDQEITREYLFLVLPMNDEKGFEL